MPARSHPIPRGDFGAAEALSLEQFDFAAQLEHKRAQPGGPGRIAPMDRKLGKQMLGFAECGAELVEPQEAPRDAAGQRMDHRRPAIGAEKFPPGGQFVQTGGNSG